MLVTDRDTQIVRWVGDIRDDPHHHARRALDSMLTKLARDLLDDDATRARTEDLKERSTCAEISSGA